MPVSRCAGVTLWMKKWEQNGWRKADGEKVQNRRELAKLARELAAISVRWVSERIRLVST